MLQVARSALGAVGRRVLAAKSWFQRETCKKIHSIIKTAWSQITDVYQSLQIMMLSAEALIAGEPSVSAGQQQCNAKEWQIIVSHFPPEYGVGSPALASRGLRWASVRMCARVFVMLLVGVIMSSWDDETIIYRVDNKHAPWLM